MLVAPLFSLVAISSQAQTPSNGLHYSRTSSFTYYGAGDGVWNGLLKSETVEPGNAQLCATTTYGYDGYGNKSGATTANCAGASGVAVFASRSSASSFGSQSTSVTVTAANGTPSTVPVSSPAGIFATSASNALSQSESHVFDPRFGAMVQLTGPNQLVTRWQLDDFGRTVAQIAADGTSTVTTYCYRPGGAADTSSNSPSCGNSAPAEMPGNAVFYTQSEPHDASGAKMGGFVRVYSDVLGRQVRSATESFDGNGQAKGLIVQDTVYNASGAKVIQTQPYFLASGSSTATGSNDMGLGRTDYDELGRPVAVYSADPHGSQSIAFGAFGNRQAAVQIMAYSGLTTTVTNDKGQTRKEEHDLSGQTARVTDATGAQVAYQHDAFGNLTKTVDALQNQIVVTYDIRGRKTQLVDPDSGTSVYAYDALGQLKSQQNANQIAAGTTTTLGYDLLGRLTSRTEPEYTSNWYYDKNADGSTCMQGSATNRGTGKLCESVTTNGVDKKIVYDPTGRPVNSRTAITNGPVFASAVAYDDTTGRVASQTYPTGLQIGYSYTTGAVKGFLEKLTLLTPATVTPLPATPGGAAGGSRSLTAGTALWQAQLVNAWGKAERQLYSNNVLAQAQFEAATGRVTGLTAGASGSNTSTVLNQSYVWDSLGNLTGRADANGDGSGGAVSETFTYGDSLNRLTGYNVSAPAIANLNRSVTLQYNALGMLLAKSDVGDYTYGSQGAGAVRPHALQSIAGAVNSNYGFDANGNVTSTSSAQFSSIAYTSFNLPDSQSGIVGTANGGSRYTWLYDESHARIKEVRTVSAGTFAGTRTTWNLHPDNQGGLGFESEVNAPSYANASNVASTSNRHYLTVGGQTIGLIMTSGAVPSIGSTTTAPPTLSGITIVKLEYWHQDQVGSLISTTDHAGAVTQRYAYDPFGKRRFTNGVYDVSGTAIVDWSAGVNHGTERGFTGHQELDEVGLVHMNGRLFDATLGTFLQADPMIQDPGNLQNYNRYGYCFNNPLGCRDPSGYSTLFPNLFRGESPLSPIKWIDPLGYRLNTAVAQNRTGYVVGQIVIGVVSLYCTGAYAACVAGGEAAWAGFAGKSNIDAAKIGVISGATAYAFQEVGTQWAGSGKDATFTSAFMNTVGHAAVGCASSVASGGKCQEGALAAGFSAGFSNSIGGYSTNPVIGAIESSIAGGVASVLGGGKFSNGAVTGAFGYLFNECLHTRMCGSASTTSIAATANPAGGIAGVLYTEPTSLHFGFVISDGYGSQRIDGIPSCFICSSPNLDVQFGSTSSRQIVDTMTLSPPSGMSLGDMAAAIRGNALILGGSVPYSYPSFGSGQMAPKEYNSNSLANSIYYYSTGNLLGVRSGVPYQAPGLKNIIQKP